QLTLDIQPPKPSPSADVIITITAISGINTGLSVTNHNNATFAGLAVGNYTYEVQYGDPSCMKTGFFSIDRSGTVGPLEIPDESIVPPFCAGTASGSITLNVPGEEGEIFEWSLNDGDFSPFVAGSIVSGIQKAENIIRVRRSDADVCTSDIAFTMPGPEPITATFSTVPASCNGDDGAIRDVAISGGSGAGYTWS